MLGIAGLVGAGRSELLRAIYGVDDRDAGEVLVDGRRLPPNRPDRAIAAGLGLAPEDRKSQALLLGWSLTKNVTLADIGRFQRIVLRVRAERAAAEEQLRALQTKPDDSERPAQELSGGNQQKVVLARWLLRRSRILLLDEPTRGVDVSAKAELYRIITDLANQGFGVVVVSSEIEELCGLCTRILVMREGEIGGRPRRLPGHRTRRLAPRDAEHAGDGRDVDTTDRWSRIDRWRGDLMSTSAPPSHARHLGPLAIPTGVQLQEYTLAGVILVLIVVGAVLKPDTFPTADNLRAVVTQASVVGVLAIGMTFVIATAGIDLSVGSVVAAAGVAGGLLVDNGSLAFILGAIGFGLLLGLVNATSIAYGRVIPFIATLAMFAIARGLALQMSGKSPISLLGSDGVRWFGTGEILTVPVSVVVFLAHHRSAGGSCSTGPATAATSSPSAGNREAARIAGVPVRRIVFSVYCMTGLLAGVAAVLLCGRLASASPVSGQLLELDAIGATVIGGTSLSGGKATIVGTFLGVMVFAVIFNLLTQLNLATEWQQIVKGVIILAAVLIQRPGRD